MGSSGIINVPSRPSSSSSSSSSSRVHQPADNEGEDRVGMGMGGKISNRKRFSKKLGHGVPRLNRDGVENGRKLKSLNRGIEELDKGDNQLLNLEIEQLERKVLMLMLAKELKGDELGKLGEDDEILKAMKLSGKLKDLGIGAEERKKKSGKAKVPKPEISRRKSNPIKPKVTQKIEKTGKKIHEAYFSDDQKIEKTGKKIHEAYFSDDQKIEKTGKKIHEAYLSDDQKIEKTGKKIHETYMSDDQKIEKTGKKIHEAYMSDDQKIEKTGKKIHEAYLSDNDGDKDEKKLSKEIEILEAMIDRGRHGLADLQTMMEEVKAIKGSEKMEHEIKERMAELEAELQELENAIVSLKRKKVKQLTGQIQQVEEIEMKYEEHEEEQGEEDDYYYNDEYDDEDDDETMINWGSFFGSVGAIAVAAAAVFFMGRSSSKVEFKSEKNRRQNESRSASF